MQKPDAKSLRTTTLDSSSSNSLVSLLKWLLYLPIHFPVQIAALNFLAMCLFASAHAPEMAFLTGCGAVAGMAQLRSTRSVVMPVKERVEAKITLVQSNVLYQNKRFAEFHRYLRAKQPDIVALEEVTEAWEQAARDGGLFQDYPHYITADVPHDDVCCKIALLSKEPFDYISVEWANAIDPVIVARRDYGGSQLNILVLHPRPPLAPRFFARQLAHFEFVESMKEKLIGSTIVLGDLNSTPWLPQFKKLLSCLSLRDVRDDAGDEIVPTWPAPVELFGIPLDYCLVTPNLVLRKFETGPRCGSDHLPLYVDLDLVG